MAPAHSVASEKAGVCNTTRQENMPETIKDLVKCLQESSCTDAQLTLLKNITEFVGKGPDNRNEAFSCGIVDELVSILSNNHMLPRQGKPDADVRCHVESNAPSGQKTSDAIGCCDAPSGQKKLNTDGSCDAIIDAPSDQKNPGADGSCDVISDAPSDQKALDDDGSCDVIRDAPSDHKTPDAGGSCDVVYDAPSGREMPEADRSCNVTSDDSSGQEIPGADRSCDVISDALLEQVACLICQLSQSDEAHAYPAQMFLPLMPYIIDLLKLKSHKIQGYIAEALSCMSFLLEHKDQLIEWGVVPLIIDVLHDLNQPDKLLEGAYYTLGNLAYADKRRAEMIAQQGALLPIVNGLRGDLPPKVLTRCAAALRHICYNSITGAEQAVALGAFQKIFSLLSTPTGKVAALDTLKTLALAGHNVSHIVNPEYDLIKQIRPLLAEDCRDQGKAVLVLTNTINTADSAQIEPLVDQGILDVFPDLLDSDHEDILQGALACIIVIVKKGGARKLSYCKALRENGALTKTEELQKHSKKHIWGISAKICELCQERLTDEETETRDETEVSAITQQMNEIQEQRAEKCVEVVRPLLKVAPEEGLSATLQELVVDPENPQTRDLTHAVPQEVVVDPGDPQIRDLTHSFPQTKDLTRAVLQQLVVDPEDPQTKDLTHAIRQTMDDVVAEIGQRDPRLQGEIHGVGSHYDFTKTPPADEQDYVYVLTADELSDLNIVRAHSQELMFNVHYYQGEDKPEWKDIIPIYSQLHSLKLYQKFCELVNEAFTMIELPADLEFGGICSPGFSGLRENHPAMTVQFVYKKHFTVHVDLSVGIPISTEKIHRDSLSAESRARIQTLEAKNVDIKMLLVPTDSSPFKLGTTLIENALIGPMTMDSPLKSAIILCKYFNSKAFTVHAPPSSASDIREIQSEIQQKVKMSIKTDSVVKDFADLLSEVMGNTEHFGPERVALFARELKAQDKNHKDVPHVMEKLLHASWILRQGVHPYVQNVCDEREKEFITSPSCLFKYKAMEYFLDGKIAAGATGLGVCVRILQEFMKQLQDSHSPHRFKHPLLGYNLNLKSFSPYLVNGHVNGVDIMAVKRAHINTIKRVLEPLRSENQLA